MLKLNSSSLKVFFSILILFFNNLTVYGQKPPTSGPNIEDEENLTPIIIGGSVLVVAAGSYFYLKSKGPKIPVTENLQDYLWSQNIMPTSDAMHLMYELNPGLRGEEVMRVKKKLVSPEFPEIPEEIKLLTNTVPPTHFGMSANLKEMVEAFKSSLNAFRDINLKTTNPASSPEAFKEILSKIEALLTSPERNNEARGSVRDLLLAELLTVINQTIDEAILSQELSGEKLVLLTAIEEDLKNLLIPNLTPQLVEPENIGLNHLADREMFLASAYNGTENWNTKSILNKEINSGIVNPIASEGVVEMWFAFAVYKYNAEGELITKGNEVEKRYQISFTLPSLKDNEKSFLPMEGNASYGYALLGNGKYYFKVKEDSVEVPIQNPLIHFGMAFQNPLKELHKGLTKVTIYLSR